MKSPRAASISLLPENLAHRAAGIIAQVREHGGQFVTVDGRWSLKNARRVPASLQAEVRANADAVKVALSARSEQLALGLGAPAETDDFWAHQDRRFDVLLAEFGIPVDRSSSAKRRVA